MIKNTTINDDIAEDFCSRFTSWLRDGKNLLWNGRSCKKVESTDLSTELSTLVHKSAQLGTTKPLDEKLSPPRLTESSEEKVKSPPIDESSFCLKVVKDLIDQEREIFNNRDNLQDFVLERFSSFPTEERNEKKLHDFLSALNIFYLVIIQSKSIPVNPGVAEDELIKVVKDIEWAQVLKDIWDQKNILLTEAQNKRTTKSHLGEVFSKFITIISNEKLLKIAVTARTYQLSSDQQSAKEMYLIILDVWRRRAALLPIITGIEFDDSAIEYLVPLVPVFEFDDLKTQSPFSKKKSLQSHFLSQNISGSLPIGLEDTIMTIAASYDETYKSLTSKFGLHCEKGIILHGPPGTGKTVMAKAVADYLGCSPSQISVTSGSNLLDKWVGGTEKGIRALFDPAKKDPNSLHVIIIDEIDAILRSREHAQVSHEVSQVTQFLTELDGINSAKNVFVIGITNYIDQLDPAAIRPGRLGTLIEVPLADEEGRKSIFELYLKKIDQELLESDYEILVEQLANKSLGLSQAEIKATVQRTSNEAFMKIIRKRHFDTQPTETPLDMPPITLQDFLNVLDTIRKQKEAALSKKPC